MTDTQPGESDTLLDEPIKVRWTGYARGRISEYNADYSEENFDEDGLLSPDRFLRTVNRQKTNVVIKTLEEAEALRTELTSYDSSQRIWMNSSMDRALSRVCEEITEQMAGRGYEPVWEESEGQFKTYKRFRGYDKI